MLFAFLMSFVNESSGQSVGISAEFRPRTEWSHGYQQLATDGQDASLFTTQRTRLNLTYKNEFFASKLVMQDVRLWGSQPQLTGNEEYAISVHEAWAEAFIWPSFSARFGRQELIYDNHRIFGNVGWAQQGRTHDLMLFRYTGDFRFDIGLAHNENGNRRNDFYEGPDAYKSMQFGWFHYDWECWKLSFLFVNNGVPKAKEVSETGELLAQETKYSQTLGPYIEYKGKNWGVSGNAYLQTGKTVVSDDLSAFEFLVETYWKASENWTFKVGFEMLSGTAFDDAADEDRSFKPLYGTNHKFNGFMDYFYVGSHMTGVGLNDLVFKGVYVKNKIKVGVDLHAFSAQADLTADADKYLGTEVDFTFTYAVAPSMGVQFGYSQMFAGESMELLKGGDKDASSNWAYLMLTFKPNLFKQ